MAWWCDECDEGLPVDGGLPVDEELFDADELGLDPEEDDCRHYPGHNQSEPEDFSDR